ncbi:MAG TPA: RNA-binding protein [Spirochaetia bacterium]|nr:RNA-binding protein [Spirochaetia bacterium]
MAKKIYVGNMNYATTEDQISELFAEFGNVVSADIIVDRFSGQSKGFGFVEMESDDDAQAAIEALNGREVDGRQLRVNEAKERPAGGAHRPPRRD